MKRVQKAKLGLARKTIRDMQTAKVNGGGGNMRRGSYYGAGAQHQPGGSSYCTQMVVGDNDDYKMIKDA